MLNSATINTYMILLATTLVWFHISYSKDSFIRTQATENSLLRLGYPSDKINWSRGFRLTSTVHRRHSFHAVVGFQLHKFNLLAVQIIATILQFYRSQWHVKKTGLLLWRRHPHFLWLTLQMCLRRFIFLYLRHRVNDALLRAFFSSNIVLSM